MSAGEIIGIVATFVIVAGLAVILVGAWALRAMEQYRADLEGVEMSEGQLHDVVVPGDWE